MSSASITTKLLFGPAASTCGSSTSGRSLVAAGWQLGRTTRWKKRSDAGLPTAVTEQHPEQGAVERRRRLA